MHPEGTKGLIAGATNPHFSCECIDLIGIGIGDANKRRGIPARITENTAPKLHDTFQPWHVAGRLWESLLLRWILYHFLGEEVGACAAMCKGVLDDSSNGIGRSKHSRAAEPSSALSALSRMCAEETEPYSSEPRALLTRLRRIVLEELRDGLFEVLVVPIRVFLERYGFGGISAPDQLLPCGVVQSHH